MSVIDDRPDVLQAQAYFKKALKEAGATFGDDTWADWYESGCGVAEHSSFSIEFSPPSRPELKFRLRLIFPWEPEDADDLPEVYMHAGGDRNYRLICYAFRMKDSRPEPTGKEGFNWPALFSDVFPKGVELIDENLRRLRMAEQDELDRRRRLAERLRTADARKRAL